MAIPSSGLQSYVQRTQKSINRVSKTSSNPASQRMLSRYSSSTSNARKTTPITNKTVFSANAPKPRPQPTDTADIAAPMAAATHIGDRQEAIQAPATDLPETINPNDTSAIDALGTQSTQNEQLLAQKRQQDAAALAAQSQNQSGGGGGEWGTGEFDGNAFGGLDAEQSKYAQLIITAGRARGLGEADIQTAIATALAESGLRNVNYGDRDSVGLFQQRTSQGWGSIDQILDPNYSINKFYDALSGIGNRGQMSQWQAAQAVQRSAFADGSNYKAQYDKALNIYRSYSTGASTAPQMGANGSASWINSNNGKYHDYDGAYGAQCVDLYNFYMTGFAGANPMQSRVSGAKDIWNNYDNRALTRVQAGQRPQQGDVVVWGGSWGGGYGHVGIVAGVNPDGTLKVLNANATSAGSKGNTVISNYGTGGILGYLRPNKLMGR